MSDLHILRDRGYRMRVNGKWVRFTFNPWYDDGLNVLDADGKWAKKQPGPRSAFHAAFKRWLKRNHKRVFGVTP